MNTNDKNVYISERYVNRTWSLCILLFISGFHTVVLTHVAREPRSDTYEVCEGSWHDPVLDTQYKTGLSGFTEVR